MQTQQDLPSYDMRLDGSDVIHQVSKHWFRILEKHRELDRTIQDSYDHYDNDLKIKEGYEHYRPDQYIKSLKLNKLHLKQEIEIVRNEVGDLLNIISKP